MQDQITIYKVNTDKNEELSSQLQIQGLPTMIFVGMNAEEPALRTEGLLPVSSILDIVTKMGVQPAATPAADSSAATADAGQSSEVAT